MTNSIGPCMAGGFESVVSTDASGSYSIMCLAGANNDALQAEGEPPSYFYVPATVRLARHPLTKDYAFRLLHFVGIQTEDSHVGVQGTREIAGGLLSFSTTSAFPPDVMKQLEEQLFEKVRGRNDQYWGWNGKVRPNLRGAVITESTTTLTNLQPRANGMPAVAPGPSPDEGGDGEGGDDRSAPARRRLALSRREPRTVKLVGRMPQLSRRDASNLDAWYWDIQGQGKSSTMIPSTNAFSGLIGSLPAAILWESFRGAYGGITVVQAMKLKVWSPAIHIKIEGNWDSIFDHFSANLSGKYMFASADIKAELNNLITSGGIKVLIERDPTLPGGPGEPQDPTARIDLILKHFMKQAEERIFTPAPVVPAAEGRKHNEYEPWGGSLALKYRRDTNKLKLFYEETAVQAYIHEEVIGGTLEGFYNEIKADPANEAKYFGTLNLDGWERKVPRFVSPAVNWPDPSDRTSGDPVHAVAVSVGYPDQRGAMMWDGKVFLRNPDSDVAPNWKTAFTMKKQSEVSSPPKGWAPDVTFVRRTIEFANPPRNDPYTRFFIDKKKIELDPPGGTPWTDNYIDFAIEDVARLDLTMLLGSDLESAKQMVSVAVQPYEVDPETGGPKAGAKKRPATTFLWQYSDQYQARRLVVYADKPGVLFGLRYQVTGKVKGGLLTKGLQWTGPWVERAVSEGEVLLDIPKPNDPGVTKRSLVPARAEVSALATTKPALLPAGSNGESEEGEPPATGVRRSVKGNGESKQGEPATGGHRKVKVKSRVNGYDTGPNGGSKMTEPPASGGNRSSRFLDEEVDDPNEGLDEELDERAIHERAGEARSFEEDDMAASWSDELPEEEVATGRSNGQRDQAEQEDELGAVWTPEAPR